MNDHNSGQLTSRVDIRTRPVGVTPSIDPDDFWAGPWNEAIKRNGDRANSDARYLALPPIAIAVGERVWTLRRGVDTLEVVPGCESSSLRVAIDEDAFSELMQEQRTALGLVIGDRVVAEPMANALFCAWDPVLRSVLDGRGVYRAGDVTLQSTDGTALDLDQQYRLGESVDDAAHFLAEAGFLVLQNVFTEAEMDAVDADLARAVEDARPDDGTSWWATTRAGDQYPCRIIDFAQRSDALRDLLADPRFLAIGEVLNEGHQPGDPFGEHFSEVTAEGLLKRVDSVEGLACLPWHKDCDRGGHSMYCSGLTVGICLTPVDKAHGGLDVMAGSHRANIARAQVDRGLDLPSISLRANRGDASVHMSCALHRSTHPVSRERRVAYTGFALPQQGGGRPADTSQSRLQRERAAIGDPSRGAKLIADTNSNRPRP